MDQKIRHASLWIVLACWTGCGSGESSPSWDAGLSVAKASWVSVGGQAYASSTKLEVSWTQPASEVAFYELEAVDQVQFGRTIESVSGTAQRAVLTGLKSGTSYEVTLTARMKDRSILQASAGGATEDETWQVQGSGNSFDTATHIIEDGNVAAHAFVYGTGAAADLQGKIRLYYTPSSGQEKGAHVGIADANASSSFARAPGTGFRFVDDPQSGPPPFGTFQGVPLSNGKVRLIMEYRGEGNSNRLVSIDSVDGWRGEDFNPGSSTVSNYPNDFGAAGPCAFSLVLGVEGDATGPPGIKHARQAKIGYPTLTDWRWNGAPGTFMFVTVDLTDAAYSSNAVNVAYAVWNGTQWNLQYSADGHPKIFPGCQAPMPVHLGNARYKMYYQKNNAVQGQTLDWQTMSDSPTMAIYGDGALGGNPDWADFEDWESTEVARRVHFVWPDGSAMALVDESKLDDFVMIMPTFSPDVQVMYTNMSKEGSAPFVGAAVLVNP